MDRYKEQAATAEAMWLGATMGAADIAHRLAKTEGVLDASQNALDEAMANQISLVGERNAYKKLAEALVREMKNPSAERRFSDPNANNERATLLEDVHRTSWKETVEVVQRNKDLAVTPRAIELSRDIARLKVLGYRSQMEDFGSSSDTGGK